VDVQRWLRSFRRPISPLIHSAATFAFVSLTLYISCLFSSTWKNNPTSADYSDSDLSFSWDPASSNSLGGQHITATGNKSPAPLGLLELLHLPKKDSNGCQRLLGYEYVAQGLDQNEVSDNESRKWFILR
jgi:hypothetical protein